MFTGTGRPQLAEVFNYVIPRYTARWKELGSKLNLSVELLSAIELGYPKSPEWCCEKMLQKWLEVDTRASWEQLNTAVSVLNDDEATAGIKYIPYCMIVCGMFLNEGHTHSWPKAGCGHIPGLLKLFSEKCVCVCVYVCLSFLTHVSKALEAKSSLYMGNEDYIEPVLT